MRKRRSIEEGMRVFETPWMVRQVETHLIFGPISRRVPLAYVMFVLAGTGLGYALFPGRGFDAQRVGAVFDRLIFLMVPFLMLGMTRRQQAMVGFVAVKGAVGVAAFMMITIGATTSFLRHQADAWPNLWLGLIWLPGLEFVPRITPQQKYLTLARMVLTIPCVIFGVRSGCWH